MRKHRGRVGLMAIALVGVLVSGASADIVTERSASVLVFPRVIANVTRDTVIQITNTSNSMVHAHCFYVNAAPTFPELPPDPIFNPPLWQETDFDIWLTKQQPTYWRVSTGRTVQPDPPCTFNPANNECPNAGIDPGAVPPVVEYFEGELKCVEVDQVGAPISGNHLKGEATVITFDQCVFPPVEDPLNPPVEGNCAVTGTLCTTDGMLCSADFDSAKYNGIGVLGNEFNNGDGRLCLGGESNEQCPDPEYNGCPDVWILNHFSPGAPDPVLGEDSNVQTRVTIVPCTQNFETQVPETVTVHLLTYNEFESRFSSETQVTCWADYDLRQINANVFNFDNNLLTTFAQTRFRSTAASAGIMMVATELHQIADDDRIGSAAFNVHHEGQRLGQDIITIPGEQLQ